MATANILSKMEYANDSADANKLNAIYAANPSLLNLPAGAVDAANANARNCDSSSAVDFLYLSTIRGGRNMNRGGGCGCDLTGGNNDNYDDDDINNLGDESEKNINIIGGCFTCKAGGKKITRIYSTIHIIIPTLYSKYKKQLSMKEKKIKKPKVLTPLHI